MAFHVYDARGALSLQSRQHLQCEKGGKSRVTTVSTPIMSASQPPAPAPSTTGPSSNADLVTTGSSELTTTISDTRQTKRRRIGRRMERSGAERTVTISILVPASFA
jgi:hypothetical protein